MGLSCYVLRFFSSLYIWFSMSTRFCVLRSAIVLVIRHSAKSMVLRTLFGFKVSNLRVKSCVKSKDRSSYRYHDAIGV